MCDVYIKEFIEKINVLKYSTYFVQVQYRTSK